MDIRDLLCEYNLNREAGNSSTLIHLVGDRLRLSPPEEKFSLLLEVTNSIGSTCVHKAAWRGHVALLKRMLDGLSETQVNSLLKSKNKPGFIALHYAVIESQLEVINFVLHMEAVEAYTLLKMQNNEGWTAFHHAAIGQNSETIGHLLTTVNVDERSTLLRIQDSDGKSALHRAAMQDNYDTMQLMLDLLMLTDRVYLIDLVDNNHNTPASIGDQETREIFREYRLKAVGSLHSCNDSPQPRDSFDAAFVALEVRLENKVQRQERRILQIVEEKYRTKFEEQEREIAQLKNKMEANQQAVPAQLTAFQSTVDKTMCDIQSQLSSIVDRLESSNLQEKVEANQQAISAQLTAFQSTVDKTMCDIQSQLSSKVDRLENSNLQEALWETIVGIANVISDLHVKLQRLKDDSRIPTGGCQAADSDSSDEDVNHNIGTASSSSRLP